MRRLVEGERRMSLTDGTDTDNTAARVARRRGEGVGGCGARGRDRVARRQDGRQPQQLDLREHPGRRRWTRWRRPRSSRRRPSIVSRRSSCARSRRYSRRRRSCESGSSSTSRPWKASFIGKDAEPPAHEHGQGVAQHDDARPAARTSQTTTNLHDGRRHGLDQRREPGSQGVPHGADGLPDAYRRSGRGGAHSLHPVFDGIVCETPLCRRQGRRHVSWVLLSAMLTRPDEDIDARRRKYRRVAQHLLDGGSGRRKMSCDARPHWPRRTALR